MAHHRSLTRTLLAPALALLALSGCATGFNANVSRFHQVPVAQGQSFTIVADDPRLAGGLEFAHYASIVASRMGAVGYRPSADPAAADLIVRMRYDIDAGKEKVRTDYTAGPYNSFYRGPFSYGRWGGFYGQRYGWGYYDPFLFDPGYPVVESYTVYTSTLELKIDKVGGAAGSGRLFEGKASAQSLSNKLTWLVPNLIDAMFTGFPGTNGETIRITVPPEPKNGK